MKSIGLNVTMHVFEKIAKLENNGTNDCNFIKLLIDDPKCCNEVCISIATNHQNIVKKLYENGDKIALIFEDDARFVLPFNKNKMIRIIKWLQNNENNWDIFYLGHLPSIPIGIPINSDIMYLPFCTFLSHAFIINRNAMKMILNMKIDGSIDSKMGKSNLKKYAMFPQQVFQKNEPHLYDKHVGKYIGVRFNYITILLEYFSYYSLLIICTVIIMLCIKYSHIV
jgi:hypothetical protein